MCVCVLSGDCYNCKIRYGCVTDSVCALLCIGRTNAYLYSYLCLCSLCTLCICVSVILYLCIRAIRMVAAGGEPMHNKSSQNSYRPEEWESPYLADIV